MIFKNPFTENDLCIKPQKVCIYLRHYVRPFCDDSDWLKSGEKIYTKP